MPGDMIHDWIISLRGEGVKAHEASFKARVRANTTELVWSQGVGHDRDEKFIDKRSSKVVRFEMVWSLTGGRGGYIFKA